jgi:SAM-dependent methyltransferase
LVAGFILVIGLGYVFIKWRARPSKEAQIFSAIYENSVWGTNDQGEGHSGSGATMRATVVYRAYLQAFLREHQIRSVVDAGCGDWESTQAIDWTGVDYKGYDIVEAVITKDRARFSAPNIDFFVANVVDDNLPPADLLICKHVLQHLPNRDVIKFLRQLSKYKHTLLVNGVNPESFSAENRDIAVGEYRPLDPTKSPFGLTGKKVLTYWDGFHMHQVVHVHNPG